MAETFLHAAENNRREPRYLALGDSYTIGERVADADCWPMQLARALRADGAALADPRIIAQTGWSTDELDAAIDAAHPLPEYDLVSLLIGVNNQFRRREVGEYGQHFAALLARAIGFAQSRPQRVLALSIPDWGVTPFAKESGRDAAWIAEEIDAFNAAASAVCAQRGVAFVDITPLSRARGAEAAMLVDDGLHPSASMYAEWVRLALPRARALLGIAP